MCLITFDNINLHFYVSERKIVYCIENEIKLNFIPILIKIMLTRRNIYLPKFSKFPAKIIEPLTGASIFTLL